MDKTLFERLSESMRQMNEIDRGERAPARERVVDTVAVREVRHAAKLSQTQFAALIGVQVGTLRNWEQRRREPSGPAKALIRAIRTDPAHVIKALG